MPQNDAASVPGMDAALSKALARRLRHEVGDFLQKVYASVAILQGRLPAEWRQERDILTRLRRQAEACKDFLDTLQDFLSPARLSLEPFDLAGLTAGLARETQGRWPGLEIQTEASGPVTVLGDFERIGQVGRLLLTNACEAARRRVTWRTTATPETRQAEWTLQDDGPGVPPEMMDRLFTPFFSTRPDHAGLGLALARKLVLLHAGRLTVANVPGGGFQVKIILPQGPEPSGQ
jgi:signal transduction histidine kinase